MPTPGQSEQRELERVLELEELELQEWKRLQLESHVREHERDLAHERLRQEHEEKLEEQLREDPEDFKNPYFVSVFLTCRR